MSGLVRCCGERDVSRMMDLERAIIGRPRCSSAQNAEPMRFIGQRPTLLTAPHATIHLRHDRDRYAEIGTASLAALLHELAGVHALVTVEPGSIDPSAIERCTFKDALAKMTDETQPILALDLHALHPSRPIDCDLGAMGGGSLREDEQVRADLRAALRGAGMKHVTFDRFAARGTTTLTRWFVERGIDCIQCEINSQWLLQPGCDEPQIRRFMRLVDALARFLVRYRPAAIPGSKVMSDHA